jgi:ATP-dependent phosphoenolpyruvate carboxykinase
LGITEIPTVYKNLTYPELFEHEKANNEGVVAKAEYGDVFTVDTGKYTGRSPKDRWIVLNPGSETEANIDWNSINQATTPEVYDELYEKAVAHFNTVDKAYVFDGYAGANPVTRKKIRFVHETPGSSTLSPTCLFVRKRRKSLKVSIQTLPSLTAAVKSMRTGKSMA